jgi:hypothetical protein
MIWTASEAPESLRVVYAEEDLGRGSRLTVLDPDTFERRRAAGLRVELSSKILEQFVPLIG